MKIFLLLLVTATVVVGMLQNTDVVTVRFLWMQAQVSQFVLTVVMLGFGVLIGAVAAILLRRRRPS